MSILDQHCAEENDKLAQRGGRRVPKSEYDFLYLPVDFRYVLLVLLQRDRSPCGCVRWLLFCPILADLKSCLDGSFAQDQVQQGLRLCEHDVGASGAPAAHKIYNLKIERG